jgi:hypothetical protein
MDIFVIIRALLHGEASHSPAVLLCAPNYGLAAFMSGSSPGAASTASA